jgi:putative endonuclease
MPRLRLLESFVLAADSLAIRLKRRPRRPLHLELGSRGEEAAFFYLRRQEVTVVARGWRSGKAPGDLDLVGWEDNTLCFFEVKTRSSHDVKPAEAAVDEDKMRALRRLARQYLLAMPTPPDQTRFDIISIYYETEKPTQIGWLRDAFAWRARASYR